MKGRHIAPGARLRSLINKLSGGELPVLYAAKPSELGQRIGRLLSREACRQSPALCQAAIAIGGVCLALVPIAALRLVPRAEVATSRAAIREGYDFYIRDARADELWQLMAAADNTILRLPANDPARGVRYRRGTASAQGRTLPQRLSSLTPTIDWRWEERDQVVVGTSWRTEPEENPLRNVLAALTGFEREDLDGPLRLAAVLIVPHRPERSRALLVGEGRLQIVGEGTGLGEAGSVLSIRPEGVRMKTDSGMLELGIDALDERSEP